MRDKQDNDFDSKNKRMKKSRNVKYIELVAIAHKLKYVGEKSNKMLNIF